MCQANSRCPGRDFDPWESAIVGLMVEPMDNEHSRTYSIAVTNFRRKETRYCNWLSSTLTGLSDSISTHAMRSVPSK
jgi:hypothetical protein